MDELKRDLLSLEKWIAIGVFQEVKKNFVAEAIKDENMLVW